MTIKSIVVHVDSTDRSRVRLDLALKLAKRLGARVQGLFAETDTGRGAEADVQVAYHRAKQEFPAALEVAGVQGALQACATGNHHQVTRGMIEAARRADLAVLGQHDSAAAGRVPADLAEQVVVNSGRPALVVPYAGHFRDVGKHAVLAWNGGRESARAAGDAIPLLGEAEMVSILAINPNDAGTLDGQRIGEHYGVHGTPWRGQRIVIREEVGVASMILNHCTDTGADMLIMGAFGHYGFPYLLRGGVTRDILQHMTVPVLLSH